MATVLKRGSTGAAVKDLRRLLNTVGAVPHLAVEGQLFDEQTDAAVRDFQASHGLVVDGKVGVQTMTALKRSTAAPKAGKPEPAKGGIMVPVPGTVPSSEVAAAPSNVGGLKLLATARPIHEIIIHCTATPEGKDYTVDDIRAWHKQRGWSDIGYHYVVARDGRVFAGRPIGQIGAHVEGHNTGTIGISYIGGLTRDGLTAKDTRTAAQRSSLLWLTRQLVDKFPVIKVTGHNQYANKACPSFDVRKDPLGAIA